MVRDSRNSDSVNPAGCNSSSARPLSNLPARDVGSGSHALVSVCSGLQSAGGLPQQLWGARTLSARAYLYCVAVMDSV